MTEKTTNNNKIIESEIMVKLIYVGQKEGNSFRIPYDLHIREIGGSEYEKGVTTITYNCEIPTQELYGINTVLYEPFLCTEQGDIFNDEFFILDTSNKDVLSVKKALGFDDLQILVVVENREIYSTNLRINKYDITTPVKLVTGRGYERMLDANYSVYIDNRELQIKYSVTAEKNGKSVTIDSRYTTEKEGLGLWESYNPDGTGWNPNNNWSSGWSLHDQDEQVLQEILEVLESNESSFKDFYYSGWIEDAEIIDLFDVREFEIDLDDFKDSIGNEPFHRYFSEITVDETEELEEIEGNDEIDCETIKFTVKIEGIEFVEE